MLSVNEYEATVAHARRLSSPMAQDLEGVGWAVFASPVEDLTGPPESSPLRASQNGPDGPDAAAR
jgi:hypothetical protein